MLIKKVLFAISLNLLSCIITAEEIQPVNNFNISQYLGKWYEIARLDHWFERDMTNVSAEYSLHKKGGIKVLNKGLKKGTKWKTAEGRANFIGQEDQGLMKVSFFWPFSTPYLIFELDDAYQYAFVTSDSRSYLWFLSRKPCVTEDLKKHFERKIDSLEFDKNELIYVDQDCVKSNDTDVK